MGTTRYLGNCQICEGDYKLRDYNPSRVLVHHGYTRPGYGYIVGDCPGVNQLPYEVSCEALKTYLPRLQAHWEEKKAYLTRLEAGEITYIAEVHPNRRGGGIDTTEYICGVTEPYTWMQAIQHRISQVGYEIGGLDREITRVQNRISAWKLMPIRTIEEEMVKVEADRKARAEEAQKRREEKAAKRRAIHEKQVALEAKRQAIRDDFANKFRALAASPEKLADRQNAARELAYEMKKAKYRSAIGWARDLDCDDALITLGLARRENDWVRYEHPL